MYRGRQATELELELEAEQKQKRTRELAFCLTLYILWGKQKIHSAQFYSSLLQVNHERTVKAESRAEDIDTDIDIDIDTDINTEPKAKPSNLEYN